ncbi:phosphoribosyl transferase domain-containing protein [Pseudomonas sp. BAY1663]|uniref:Phosphoribosyltransferase n=1 Tax=Stutzerimonas stutzeri TaxID=316 RepID=A0A2N8T7B6_STUST|nr:MULTISPECIES: phosphoribosyltransferase [Pseudomonadaceae]EXF42970.1 phosphoribosyl transferase domain-containing protein [Pseudomonas sp. BAY1663]MCQ4323610.1 phosphoribosyltransferase [Stutzerimonas stutzeri]PNG10582.1 phosphoribosyltransferase [Stutzerimonas stutzeri]
MSMFAQQTHLFRDRQHAGQELAEALLPLADEHPLVLALPRGGVPVAFEVARQLKAQLDLVLVRKIGAPGNEELALGAVVDGAEPQWVVNQGLLRQLNPPESWFDEEMQRQLVELERRRRQYCGNRPAPKVAERCVIVVDDGIATGATARAALKGLARAGARHLVLAVPVGPRDVIEALREEVDELICLAMPEPFIGVGLHYANFEQTSDEAVIDLLQRAAGFAEASD